jgi:hypothetical protein
MRLRRAKTIAEIGFGILGIATIFIAIFAFQLHIDHNKIWGTKRFVIFFLGAAGFLFSAMLASSALFRRLSARPAIKKAIQGLNWIARPFRWLLSRDNNSALITRPVKNGHKSGWFAAIGAGIAILISLWFITSGRMVSWTPNTSYFDSLANGFLAGRLSLLETPPPGLVALPDPYTYQNRAGAGGYIWDASLYHGKYYYYWGPVPALLAASVKLFGYIVVQDQFLVMFAIIGLAIAFAVLFNWMRKAFFPSIPAWFVMILTFLGVLNTPVFWLVNNPTVYEVPIALGQFFLILGLFAILRGLADEKHKEMWLVTAGLAWGASIGSRANNVAAIAWLTGLACFYLILKTKTKWSWIKEIITLLLPLAIWGGGLAWYNYARFGNILETGHRYQLSRPGLPINYSTLFSLNYILPNLYNILARPMVILWHEFPFVFTPYIANNMWPKLIFYPRDPNYYYTEPIAGIFISIIASWLVFLPVIGLIREGWNWLHERSVEVVKLQDRPLTTWAGWMVAGAVFCNFAILVVFVTSSMRYEADITPLLTVLIAICIGWASNFFRTQARFRNLILALAVGLCIISIIIGLFTSFQNVSMMFVKSNPHLYSAIAHIFVGK